jgi:hypothetical protein
MKNKFHIDFGDQYQLFFLIQVIILQTVYIYIIFSFYHINESTQPILEFNRDD